MLLGDFTCEAMAVCESPSFTLSETVSLDFQMHEEEGECVFFWRLPGYGIKGYVESDEYFDTPQEAYNRAIMATYTWAHLREMEMKEEMSRKRRFS